MTTLHDLLERVERAEEPPDDLDQLDPLGMEVCWHLQVIPERGDPGYPESPTRSIDAALSIAKRSLPGLGGHGHDTDTTGTQAYLYFPDAPTGSRYREGTGATPALALLAALLRAKIGESAHAP